MASPLHPFPVPIWYHLFALMVAAVAGPLSVTVYANGQPLRLWAGWAVGTLGVLLVYRFVGPELLSPHLAYFEGALALFPLVATALTVQLTAKFTPSRRVRSALATAVFFIAFDMILGTVIMD